MAMLPDAQTNLLLIYTSSGNGYAAQKVHINGDSRQTDKHQSGEFPLVLHWY